MTTHAGFLNVIKSGLRAGFKRSLAERMFLDSFLLVQSVLDKQAYNTEYLNVNQWQGFSLTVF